MNFSSSLSPPPPALVFASSYSDDEDDDAFGFPSEVVTSADGAVAFVPSSAPLNYSAAAHNDDDENDDDVFAPKTTYRDTHHAFASGPCDLVFQSEAFTESSFFGASTKSPVFVLESANAKSSSGLLFKKAPAVAASPLSPSSYSQTIDVPLKAETSYFAVNPSFPSTAAPAKIMSALSTALRSLDCEFQVVNQWTLRVELLCVAELICFSVELTRVADAGETSYQVDFLRRSGCESKFCHLTDHIRSLCSDVDAEPMPLILVEPLDAWFDAKQTISGRQFAIGEAKARALIEDLNAEELHAETLADVAKEVKDLCRHKGNRKTFLQADRERFLAALRWMLAANEILARFAVFVLAEFAKDGDADSYDGPFFSSPFDKSAFELLLEEIARRDGSEPCGQFTAAMAERAQLSWLFC